LRPTFLKIAEGRVEDEENPDDNGLDELAHGKFERDRSLQHPGNRRPELFERPTEGMSAGIRDRIWPKRSTPSISLRAGQSDRRTRVSDFRRRPEPRAYIRCRDRHRQEPSSVCSPLARRRRGAKI
jgi:hypothetical protein